MYDGLNLGRTDVARLRRTLGSMPLPRAADGWIVQAVDVSPWLRLDANTCPARAFCHRQGHARHREEAPSPAQMLRLFEPGAARNPGGDARVRAADRLRSGQEEGLRRVDTPVISRS
ncbi:transposase [Streptomyces sp. G5(2025)]|uniref:transposase n=1 Tax=Streptomyces sp. G5(2025) TaxID=3406628 RepID=UPI003C2A1C03